MTGRRAGVATIFLIAFCGSALSEEAGLIGVWHTLDQESQVRLYACGERFCGEIIALNDPTNPDGSPRVDSNNEDEALREQPILGLRILKDFERVSEQRWEEGWAYDPKEGQVFDGVEIELTSPDSLEIGGCILWGAICRSETWTRVPD